MKRSSLDMVDRKGRKPAPRGIRRTLSLQDRAVAHAAHGRHGRRGSLKTSGWGNLHLPSQPQNDAGSANATWGPEPPLSHTRVRSSALPERRASIGLQPSRGAESTTATYGLRPTSPRLRSQAAALVERRLSNEVKSGQEIMDGGIRSVPEHSQLSSEHDEEPIPVSDVSPVDFLARHETRRNRRRSRIFDDPLVVRGYASVPIIDVDRLPRGGISLETQAVGRIQFGIPPETIKDSMLLGLEVPGVYIVPVERFCREIGPALGINLAEFEFPAYFNYFVRQKRCTLVVDSKDAEENIRTVFGETLLGPRKFRDHENPTFNEDEDFDPCFPKEKRPNFYKEFYHFRTAEESTNFEELTIDTLLDFCHFKPPRHGSDQELGVPPLPEDSLEDITDFVGDDDDTDNSMSLSNIRFHVEDETQVVDVDGGSSVSTGVSLARSHSIPDIRQPLPDDVVPPSPSDSKDHSSQGRFDWQRRNKRISLDSLGSLVSKGTRSRDGMSWASGASFMLSEDDVDSSHKPWIYSRAKWLGDVATIFPRSASDDQRRDRTTPRVEIFKMMGGTEYILHDIDSNNIIVGKARFSGTVHVPDEMAVEGFLATDRTKNSSPPDDNNGDDDDDDSLSAGGIGLKAAGDEKSIGGLNSSRAPSQDFELCLQRAVVPPTFHPPSFGVTVLGNSHGFDKSGSTSGYVLWINGRGVMIDPPPYSSATLEREGIRPQMIMAIIVTHCHADHDAGTFQKVMTGMRVAVITTPTIYKSFIRKYAALSGLSPTLLRHSHRHRPAIIGQPLKFQGATFHFTYTLHTIPCISFRVEWRGRSIVFTGDHLNSPPVITSLRDKGVFTKERADDLLDMPLQECDVLLHEAGAPPIHTPLWVLKKLPETVKQRLYVVHTSALPPDSGLRVAPTGTAGTIRLDESRATEQAASHNELHRTDAIRFLATNVSARESVIGVDPATLDDGGHPSLTVHGGYVAPDRNTLRDHFGKSKIPPLVFLRPTCVSDAWFILNLLSAVPFLSSLSYANTMEVLEIAHVEMFCADEVVVPAGRRSDVVCVVWEGTCVEREPLPTVASNAPDSICGSGGDTQDATREKDDFISDSFVGEHEYGCVSRHDPTVWHAGDWAGPVALQPDMDRSAESASGKRPRDIVALSDEGVKVILLKTKDLFQILKSGSKLFRKYHALIGKQTTEASAGPNRESASASENQTQDDWYTYDSILDVLMCNSALARLTAHQKRHFESLAEGPRFFEAGQHLWRVGDPVAFAFLIVAGTAAFTSKTGRVHKHISHHDSDFASSQLTKSSMVQDETTKPTVQADEDKELHVSQNSEYFRLEIGLQLRAEEMEVDLYYHKESLSPKEERARNARDRFANKVLARLYSRKAFTPGLVFSRGHLLSDTSRMVSGSLAHIYHSDRPETMGSIGHSLANDHHQHSSNMVAGPNGCVVMVFRRSSLVHFLNFNPGVLLSLLGTQVVV